MRRVSAWTRGQASLGPCGEPRFGLFRDVGRMIVEDQFNRGIGRVGGIEA
jgi:hypothetical protein